MKGYDSYVYEGNTPVVLDKHHDEYEMDFENGDKFFHKIQGGKAHIIHELEPKIEFIATLKDRKYLRLMKESGSDDVMLSPHPKFPAYPNIKKITMDLLPKLYSYYNEKYFNNKCPKHLLFKKSNTKGIFGLATLRSGALKDNSDFYKLSVNLTNIANDPIMFIDTLLHEMIHLYLYKIGRDNNDLEAIHDSHGPRFQAEMRRLNAHGFNISITVDWEQRKDLQAVEFYYVMVKHYENMKLMWTDQNIERDIDTIYANMAKLLDVEAEIVFGVTSNQKIRSYHRLNKNLKPTPSKFKLWYNPLEIKGRVIHTIQHKVVRNPRNTFPKALIPFAVQPLPFFLSHMQAKYPSATKEEATSTWSKVKTSDILVHIFEKLDDAHHALEMGMNDSEIKRKLNYIHSCVEGRISHSEYSTKVKAYLAKTHQTTLLKYRELKV